MITIKIIVYVLLRLLDLAALPCRLVLHGLYALDERATNGMLVLYNWTDLE